LQLCSYAGSYGVSGGLARLLAVAILVPGALLAQLTTGIVEGTVHTPDGRPAPSVPILVTGSLGFRAAIHTTASGEFSLTLPYGQYQISGVPVSVAPLQTTRLDLVTGGLGAIQAWPTPGLWSGPARANVYSEAFSLPGVLLGQEPSSVTQPLDFTGLSDYRLALESQRGYSWTDTQFKLMGMDATDSYQPGRPVILPDVEALDQVVVRSAFAQTASNSYGTEVGAFLAQPGAAWHGELFTADTGSALSSTNLLPPAQRGIVQQSQLFNWFTRDSAQIGGPLTKWADIFASVTGQYASQTVPLEAPGNDQRSRLLFGNVRGRARAGSKDQFDALFSGSRVNLSGGGIPAGIEALTGRRLSPSFVLPGGFPNESEVDHLDFLQAGWTHHLPEASGLGVLQVRYGFSTAHLDTASPEFGQSRIELLDGAVTGPPPLSNFAVRSRQGVEFNWQPGSITSGPARHQIVAGARWKTSSPVNRFRIPSDMNLITANGAPAFVVMFNPPAETRENVRSFSGFVADHVSLPRGLSLDLGVDADFSRGSLPRSQTDPIAWNSASPRAGFAWRIPHAQRLVLRGTYFRLYSPLAGRYLDFGDPNSLGGNIYQWTGSNAGGPFQPGDQGALLARFGGPYSSISPSLSRPYADEFDLGAEFMLAPRTFTSIHLFRRDDKDRIGVIDTGVPFQAFSPVSVIDPYDNQPVTVYQQNPATFGQDRYLLTNPLGFRMQNTGVMAEARTEWRGVTFHASFVAEKSYGPTNPGDAVFENDPGVVGSLYLDPNTAINEANANFFDRAYVGKMQAIYRLPAALGGIEIASAVVYTDGLAFARQLLVTGLAQGPILAAATVRGSPEGGNRAQYVMDWNLRLLREFELPVGTLAVSADILNVTNAAERIQESDVSSPSFILRLPVAIQEPRSVRLQLRYQF
jgi:hypothetical protein